eukprot:scaffold929_cov63-Phaeocystis_antarctica.AAC.3
MVESGGVRGGQQAAAWGTHHMLPDVHEERRQDEYHKDPLARHNRHQSLQRLRAAVVSQCQRRGSCGAWKLCDAWKLWCVEAQAKRAARLWQDHCERETDQQSCHRAQDEWTTADGCPVVHEHQADDQRDDTDNHTQCHWRPRSARLPHGDEVDSIESRHDPSRRNGAATEAGESARC